MHVPAPAAIWSCVCAGSSAGGELDINLELRVCISQRQRRFGVVFVHVLAPEVIRTPYGRTFMNVSAPAQIWSCICACLIAGGDLDCVSAHWSAGCDLELRLCMCWASQGKCNVAVGRISCVLKSLRRERQSLLFDARLESRARFAQI